MVVGRAPICLLRVDAVASSSMALGEVRDRELSDVVEETINGISWREGYWGGK